MKTKILLTGFEPFGGEPINPSWELAQALATSHWSEEYFTAAVHAVQLPCVFGRSLQMLDLALAQFKPDMVLAIGQAAGRSELSLERVAINVDDARIPDNAGQSPVDEPILTAGPAAYFTTLPIKAMAAAVQAEGIPAGISQTAGTYVCNHVFYGLQHRCVASGVRSGFMHIPLLPEQAVRLPGKPSMPLALMVQGTRAALRAALAHTHDIKAVGGAED
ncbi:pyroglutamyl-peptidase I [Roseateles sp. BYS180W]|uniref:Pyrrolidone-carboxylate peptidase n=1 Tax=Roseateles rivi TaxID=3299028 RepID=A0ABW7FZH8_9BURK